MGHEADAAVHADAIGMSQATTIAARWATTSGRPSGFDYMRLGLSISVLLWHSYQISYGTDAALDLWRAPPGIVLQLILPMFFCLSGFLVLGSLERSRDIRKFLTLRIIRIYPALCVEVVLSAMLLGPLVTTFAKHDYFTSRYFFTYFFNVVGWIHYVLPGVFDTNPLSQIVNTSLWTVPFELECYVILPVLVWLGFLRSQAASLLMFVACTVIVAMLLRYEGESGIPAGGLHGRVLVLCFLAGAVVGRLRNVLRYSLALAAVSAIAALALLETEWGVFIAPLFLAYTTVNLGLLNPTRSVLVSSGDYSYGVYLYAAPIQQTVAWALGPANSWLTNVLLALPATLACACFSWHFVEKPFLGVKALVLRSRRVGS